jgi:hypothetical protein
VDLLQFPKDSSIQLDKVDRHQSLILVHKSLMDIFMGLLIPANNSDLLDIYLDKE